MNQFSEPTPHAESTAGTNVVPYSEFRLRLQHHKVPDTPLWLQVMEPWVDLYFSWLGLWSTGTLPSRADVVSLDSVRDGGDGHPV